MLASIHMGNMDMSIQVIRARGVDLTIIAEVEEPKQLYELTPPPERVQWHIHPPGDLLGDKASHEEATAG